ncbi:MAG: hypothetical protein ACREJT_12115, partial [Myxococcota bacterium]
MRTIRVGLLLLASVVWALPASGASVAVDVVIEQQAQNVGERDVWGVWVRSTSGVQVTSLTIFVETFLLESLELELTNPQLNPLSAITLDYL